jgi:two-component system cell cycle response regulator
MERQIAKVLKATTVALEELLAGTIPQPIDVESAQPELAALVNAANGLIAAIAEIEAFVVPLTQGDLSAPVPPRGNLLASPFKELHSRLLHLTWQASQIAKGDYGQRVDFMGEFSEAFNSMVALLAEREEKLRNAQEELRALSLEDGLTGLLNRRGFFTLGEHRMLLSRRAGTPMTLIFADLDHLKAINDEFGHPQGDIALRGIAGILRSGFRESDIVGRLGGDEFIVLAAEKPAPHSLRERIEGALEEYNTRGERPFVLSVSLGIVCLRPGDQRTLQELVDEAEADMYTEKRRKSLMERRKKTQKRRPAGGGNGHPAKP